MTRMPDETPMQHDRRLRREGAERRQAAQNADPVARASRLTEGELKRLSEADEAVKQAEAEVARLGRRIDELRRVREPELTASVNPGTGFARWLTAPRDATAARKAERELERLPTDLQAARDVLQGRVRELRRVEGEIARARGFRRVAAERKVAPERPAPRPRRDPWVSLSGGRGEAA